MTDYTATTLRALADLWDEYISVPSGDSDKLRAHADAWEQMDQEFDIDHSQMLKRAERAEAQVKALELRQATIEKALYDFEANWLLGGHMEPDACWFGQNGFVHLSKFMRPGILLGMTPEEVAALTRRWRRHD